MRVYACGILLLPLCAALTSLECVHKCLTDPIVALLPSEDAIQGIAQQGMDGNFTMPSELQNATGHEAVCSVLNAVVACLGECGTLEPSNQQEYFRRTLSNLHGLVCSAPEAFVKYAMEGVTKDFFQCYDGQRPEELAVSVIGALMVSGGVEGEDEDANLCHLASSLTRTLVNNRCSHDVKKIAVSAVEFFYRLSALKLGISDVASTEQSRLYGCRDLSNLVDAGAPLRKLVQENALQEQRAMPFENINGTNADTSTRCMQGCLRRHAISLLNDVRTSMNPCESIRPLMECVNECPSNKLQGAANRTFNLACSGSAQEMAQQCPIDNEGMSITKAYGRAVIKRMITSGANSRMSAGQNLCDVYSSFVDPTVLPFMSRLAEIEDPLAKLQCKLLHDAVVNVTSVPLRLAALKLGIPQDGFHCGLY